MQGSKHFTRLVHGNPPSTIRVQKARFVGPHGGGKFFVRRQKKRNRHGEKKVLYPSHVPILLVASPRFLTHQHVAPSPATDAQVWSMHREEILETITKVLQVGSFCCIVMSLDRGISSSRVQQSTLNEWIQPPLIYTLGEGDRFVALTCSLWCFTIWLPVLPTPLPPPHPPRTPRLHL